MAVNGQTLAPNALTHCPLDREDVWAQIRPELKGQ